MRSMKKNMNDDENFLAKIINKMKDIFPFSSLVKGIKKRNWLGKTLIL